MGQEFAGRLAEQVEIERWRPARDAAGDDVGGWERLRHAHAALRPDGGPAVPAGDAARSGGRWRVQLRDADDLGLTVRLRWRGTVLTVLGVTRDPAVPGLATLLCDGRPA